jgi:predicted ATP-dependent endonuclease of OLD family
MIFCEQFERLTRNDFLGSGKLLVMRISKVNIKNFRSFEDSGALEFKNINIITGANNSGKSSILHAIYLLQKGQNMRDTDTRLGADHPRVSIVLEEFDMRSFPEEVKNKTVVVEIEGNTKHYSILASSNEEPRQTSNFPGTPDSEPNNFIVPCFASRTTNNLNLLIDDQFCKQVSPDFSVLTSKLTGFVGSGLDKAKDFSEVIKELLGVEITTLPSAHNMVRLAYRVNEIDQIYIENMGTGVLHLLKLVYDLVNSKDKLFLIEEIETAIHPKALKRILELVEERSRYNQFILTTHSHIVVSYFSGRDDVAIFDVKQEIRNRIPFSSCREVKDEKGCQQVLVDLGNELSDFYLWDGWLILEESSAETIIKKLLIPWFCPKLKKQLCTVSAKGNSQAKSQFNALSQQFIYIHLTPLYENKAWVVLDGDDKGIKFIDDLKNKYSTWEKSHFRTWSEPAFEQYYPERFSKKVAELDSIEDANEKRQKKSQKKVELLLNVLGWAKKNEALAKSEFETSAKEVIDFLKEISQKLNANAKHNIGKETE